MKKTFTIFLLLALGGGALTYWYDPTLFDEVTKLLPQDKVAKKAGKASTGKKKKKKKAKARAKEQATDLAIAAEQVKKEAPSPEQADDTPQQPRKLLASFVPEEEIDFEADDELDQTIVDTLVKPVKKKRAEVDPGKLSKQTDWVDCKAVEQRLASSIMKKLKGASKADVTKFLQNPKNKMMLDQWVIAQADNEATASPNQGKLDWLNNSINERQNKINTYKQQLESAKKDDRDFLTKRIAEEEAALALQQEELNAPSSIKDALMTYPGAAKLLKQLTNDPEWMEQVLYSGDFKNPGRILAILSTIAEANPGLTKEKMPRAIATAVALEWAKNDWDFSSAPLRAQFHINNDKANRFHSGFRSLPFWLLRNVCSAKGDSDHGSVTSLEWALDNVHLPADQYPGSCWQGSYLLTSLFGDSVFGDKYYQAYDGTYERFGAKGRNGLQRTQEVGGVCGSLSHFGSCCAVANGIPSICMGEPQHCAYVLLIDGKWVPAYSLSWRRGLHWRPWGDVGTFSSLHMATEFYKDLGKNKKTTLSNGYRSLSKFFATRGENDLALACSREATRLQPNNYPSWREQAKLIKEAFPEDAKAWSNLNESLCSDVAGNYPEIAAGLLREHVYPNLLALPEKVRNQIVSTFWSAINGMGPDRWDIEAMCHSQLNLLQGVANNANAAPDSATANKLYSMILNNTVDKPAYAPVVLSWGNSLAASLDENTQKNFLKSTLEALSKGGDGAIDADARDRMLGQALMGAAKMGDRNSFQAIGKLLSEKYRNPAAKLPEWEPFPGELVSKGGLMRTSSTCNHDSPPSHWGVLEPTGGSFHTDSDTDAYAVVELPKMAYISGVVVIGTDGNRGRLEGMKVQYSESGKDDDWHDAGNMPNPTAERVNRLDLQQQNPRARFIRILRPGGPQYFHLNGIFVYGKPAA